MGMPAKKYGAERSEATALSFHEHRRLSRGLKVIEAEAAAVLALKPLLGSPFVQAVEWLLGLDGSLIVSGVGKAGHIGQKLAATFASTGTPSHFLHPTEALHGDLGRILPSDVVLLLSNRGETEEVIRLAMILKKSSQRTIAMTARPDSRLGRLADLVLAIPSLPEACTDNLAPTSSTTAMLALGDALAMVLKDERGFSSRDFARFHPGGSLGRDLKRVDEVMRPLKECRVASLEASIRDVIVGVARPGRRTGAVMLVDACQKLVGLYTDSDLARLLERRTDAALDEPIANHMTRSFSAIRSHALLTDALAILAERKISELPVVDESDQPIGLIDITDIVAWADAQDLFAMAAGEALPATGITESSASPATLRIFS